jgi:hypothetical protein
MIATNFYSIADLVYEPQPAAATGRIWIWPDSSRQRIADLALIVHLADHVIAGDPERYRAWPVGVSEGVGGEFGDSDDQVSYSVRRQARLVAAGSGKRPYAGQGGLVPEHLGPVGGSAQRLTRPWPRRC